MLGEHVGNSSSSASADPAGSQSPGAARRGVPTGSRPLGPSTPDPVMPAWSSNSRQTRDAHPARMSSRRLPLPRARLRRPRAPRGGSGSPVRGVGGWLHLSRLPARQAPRGARDTGEADPARRTPWKGKGRPCSANTLERRGGRPCSANTSESCRSERTLRGSCVAPLCSNCVATGWQLGGSCANLGRLPRGPPSPQAIPTGTPSPTRWLRPHRRPPNHRECTAAPGGAQLPEDQEAHVCESPRRPSRSVDARRSPASGARTAQVQVDAQPKPHDPATGPESARAQAKECRNIQLSPPPQLAPVLVGLLRIPPDLPRGT